MTDDKFGARPIRPDSIGLYPLLVTIFILLGAWAPLSQASAQAEEIWLLVDTSALTLTVMQGERTLQTYDNIAIGSNGPTRAKRVLDETTPLGEFWINVVRSSQRFHRFLGFDYPNMDEVRRAIKEDRISYLEYQTLVIAWLRGEAPPQNTSLGGYLGIHGLGAGDPELHQQINWTDGCVALTNEEIEELAERVTVGTRVSIR
jgi:murein L,D-transpeptidase YafK